MKNTSVIINSAILATVLIMTPVSVYAEPVDVKSVEADHQNHHSANRHTKMRHHFKKMAKRLNLTAEQQDKIKVIYQSQKEDKMAQKESMVIYREQVKSLFMSPTFDEQAFVTLHSQHQSQFSQMALTKAKARHAIMQVLNVEQQEKMLTMKRKGRGLF